jgi:hypothetical protein
MAAKVRRPTVECLETRGLMSAAPLSATVSPLRSAAAQCAVAVEDNFAAIAKVVQLSDANLRGYGVSNVQQLIQKYPQYKTQIESSVARVQAEETSLYNSEVEWEDRMVGLDKLEATSYRRYNQSAFNADVATFNAYNKAFWTEMLALETMY